VGKKTHMVGKIMVRARVMEILNLYLLVVRMVYRFVGIVRVKIRVTIPLP
jgi:hypothetical protein